jgi:hypothetical protein
MWPNIQQRDDNFHGKFDKIESAGVENATLVVGPDYPNLRGSYDLVSRHSHLNGSRLLGAAHPIQELPRAGVYEDLPVASFYRPVGRLHTLGADMKGISSRIMM